MQKTLETELNFQAGSRLAEPEVVYTDSYLIRPEIPTGIKKIYHDFLTGGIPNYLIPEREIKLRSEIIRERIMTGLEMGGPISELGEAEFTSPELSWKRIGPYFQMDINDPVLRETLHVMRFKTDLLHIGHSGKIQVVKYGIIKPAKLEDYHRPTTSTVKGF